MNSIFKSGAQVFAMVFLLVAVLGNAASANQKGEGSMNKMNDQTAHATMDKTMSHQNGTEIATPMIGGYDPVAYFELGKPVQGNGYHTATYQSGTYLFASKEHQEKFEANPGKYAPQFGGYCAYGVSVGKKFYSDPNRWKIVNGKLYLNLDKDIQKKWKEDIRGNIIKADAIWTQIEHKHPSEL